MFRKFTLSKNNITYVDKKLNPQLQPLNFCNLNQEE